MEKGFFGDLFDLDRNGKLDIFEQSLDIMLFQELVSEAEDDGNVEDEEW